MRCFYEYKYINGGKVGGHNLENIIIKGNIIVLRGVDILPTYYQRQTIKRLEKENNQLKEQRQELRSWLEHEIKEIDRHTTTLDIFNTYDYETIHEMETKKITYKNVLSKLN